MYTLMLFLYRSPCPCKTYILVAKSIIQYICYKAAIASVWCMHRLRKAKVEAERLAGRRSPVWMDNGGLELPAVVEARKGRV